MEIKDPKELKEIEDCIKAFMKLEAQKRNPTRDGMIDALKDALNVAPVEIRNVESSRNETTPTPWENIPDSVLYTKLSEYQQGMYLHAVNKYGEELIKKKLGI